MAGVNKVILIGNIGKDPEIKALANGESITNATLATSSKYKNKAGEMVEETEWHRVTFFGRLAEIAGQYLKKGSPAYVEGRIKTTKYTDKDGIEKYATNIIANSLQLLGSKSESNADTAPARRDAPKAAARPARSSFDDIESDIPY